ncbi:MAG: hypothetical protein ABFR75_07580 [Acidobacteriota bacterium]
MITIIGNSLNSTNKKVLDKMNKMDFIYIKRESQIQLDRGAEFIELNAVSLLDNELPFLKEAIKVIEGIGGKALIRSNSIDTLLEVVKTANNEIILGDIEYDKKKIDTILEVANHDKVKIIALIRENGGGIPGSPEKSLYIAQKFIDYLLDKGVQRKDILLDPMISPLEEDCANGKKFLNTLELFKLDFPQVKTIAHLIDLSEGLPKRQLISSHFVSLAIEKGLDYISLNTLEESIIESVITTLSIIGKDKNMQSYINFCRNSRESKRDS